MVFHSLRVMSLKIDCVPKCCPLYSKPSILAPELFTESLRFLEKDNRKMAHEAKIFPFRLNLTEGKS